MESEQLPIRLVGAEEAGCVNWKEEWGRGERRLGEGLHADKGV